MGKSEGDLKIGTAMFTQLDAQKKHLAKQILEGVIKIRKETELQTSVLKAEREKIEKEHEKQSILHSDRMLEILNQVTKNPNELNLQILGQEINALGDEIRSLQNNIISLHKAEEQISIRELERLDALNIEFKRRFALLGNDKLS